MATDLSEPVWREDIEKEVEYMGEGCRSLSLYYARAQSQGAPPELLNALADVYQQAELARQRLQALTVCFYPEPRDGQ